MIDFVAKKKVFFIISLVLILIGVVSLIIQGLNFDIEFKGGTELDINLKTDYTPEIETALKDIVNEVAGLSAQVQKTGDGQEVLIRTTEMNTNQRQEVFSKVAEKYNLEQTDLISADNVGQTMSTTILVDSLKALILAIILMLIYIAIRFNIGSGLASVAALTHDVLIMITVYSLFQIPVNNSFIAAVLTIVGYSINATIIVFDRVRELKKKQPMKDAVNKGINQSIARAINTSVTTLLTIGTLYVVGVDSIKEFALPIIVGIIAGAYSSLCLAGPIWQSWEAAMEKRRLKQSKSKKKAKKSTAKKAVNKKTK